MYKKLFHWWRIFHQYPRGDRNAVLWLSGLILFTLLIGEVVDRLPQKTRPIDAEILRAFDQWNSPGDQKGRLKEWFDFDPNTITRDQVEMLNLPVNIGRNILAYREAGGKFLKVNDIRKIYGMNDSIFKQMAPYIKIPDAVIFPDMGNTVKIHSGKVTKTVPDTGDIVYKRWDKESQGMVEINAADSAEFVKLRGIGPVFASRIIKYRELLGGYYSPAQLMEVYGFPAETYEELEPFFRADTGMVRRMRINYAEYRELLRHPYLKKQDVDRIIEYRDKNGMISAVDELFENQILDSMVYFRIKPYLSSR